MNTTLILLLVWIIAHIHIIFSHSTSQVATGHLDKTVKIWAVGQSSLHLVSEIEETHDLRITSVEYNPAQTLLLTNSWDGNIKLYDPRTNKYVSTISAIDNGFINKQENSRVTFSPDGKYIVAGDNNGKLFFWDLSNTAKPFKSILATPNYKNKTPATAPIMCVDWNPNGRQICCTDKGGYIHLFEEHVQSQ